MAVEQNIIPVSVESRFIGVSDHTHVMAGNVGVDYVKITLDSEWDGLKSFVTFTGCAQDGTTVDYTSDAIEIPWEQIEEAGELFIGVQGFEATADVTVDEEGQLVVNGTAPTLNAAAMTVPIQVFESGETGGASPQQPTQGTLQRIEQDILALEELTGDSEQILADVKAATSSANTAAGTATSAATAATEAASTADAAAGKADSAASAATTAASGADAAAATAASAASSAEEKAAACETATAAAQAVVDDEAGHRAAAKASAEAAASSASAAAASETAAASSASAAASSASDAASSASVAKGSETASGASANSAAASASAASASEASAGGYAERAEAAAKEAETIAGLTVDDAVTEGSPNPVAGGGVYSYVASTVASLRDGLVRVVDSLPDTGEPGVIYMTAAESPATGNLYAEYVWEGGAWEKLGDVQMPDLTPYAKTDDVTAAIASALTPYATTESVAAGLAGKQDTLTFDGTPTEGSSNPVTSTGVKSYADAKVAALATVASTGRYADLSGTPTVDTEVTATGANAVTGAAVATYVDGVIGGIANGSY